MTKRPILICDALNMFTRAYAAYPQMSSNGQQMGGTIGFMKMLQRLLGELQPSAVYIIWESGGSQRRRTLFSEYKLNRRPVKLNRFYDDDLPDTDENRMHQIVVLLKCLRDSPACQIYVPDCEADDVIAFLSKGRFVNEEKIIASSDKDFYQLLDEKTRVYSLHQKCYVTKDDVLETFRVSSRNFGLAKALCGDPSDNIPGVKGVGFRTVSKKLPILGSEDDILLDDVFSYCHAHIDESVIYRRIIENESDVRRNWRLVHLGASSLSAHQITKVETVINDFVPSADRVSLMKKLIKEGIQNFDVNSFLHAFVGIDGYTV